MEKKTIKRIISWVILLVFAVLAYIFLKNNVHDLKNVLKISPIYLIIVLILRFLNTLSRGINFKLSAKRYGINLPFKEWCGFAVVTTLGNYLTPFRPGASVVAVYLKKKYAFSYTSSVSLTGVLYLTQFFIYGPIGFFLTLYAPFPLELKYVFMSLFMGIFLVATFLLFFMPLPIKTNIRLLKYLFNSISRVRTARNFPFIFQMAFLNVLGMLAKAFLYYYAFRAFNFEAPLYGCILLSLFSFLSLMISLTPMGLGIKDSVIVLTSKLIGADILTGIFVAALDRAAGIILTFSLGPFFSYILFKRLNPKTVTKD